MGTQIDVHDRFHVLGGVASVGCAVNNIALSAPTAVGFVVLACTTTLAIRRNMSGLLISYLAAQTLFCLSNWWVMQRWLPQDRAYLGFFGFLFIVFCFSVVLTISWIGDFWTGSLCFLSLCVAAFFSGLLLWQGIAEKNHGVVPPQAKLIIIQGATMLVFGAIALLYLRRPLAPEISAAVFCCGLYWFLTGAWGWAFAGSLGKWKTANFFVNPMLTAGCFGWLAVMLMSGQLESARQHARDEMALSELQHVEQIP